MTPTTFLYTYMSAILPLFEKRPISGVQFRSCDSGNYCPPNNKLYPGCLIEDRGALLMRYSANPKLGIYRQSVIDISDQFCINQSLSCEDFLVDGKYPDSTASITWSSDYDYRGTFTGYKLFSNEFFEGSIHPAWHSARNDTNPYIQVVFGHKRNVTGVVITGRGRVDYQRKYIYYHWVTKYSLQFTDEGSLWYDYTDVSGRPVLIPGNDGSYNPKVHYLPDTLQLLGVRILPKKKHYFIALRFDIIGC